MFPDYMFYLYLVSRLFMIMRFFLLNIIVRRGYLGCSAGDVAEITVGYAINVKTITWLKNASIR